MSGFFSIYYICWVTYWVIYKKIIFLKIRILLFYCLAPDDIGVCSDMLQKKAIFVLIENDI